MVLVAGGGGAMERDANVTCRLSEIRANQAVLNDIVYNADAYDAFMRDGLVPWVSQMRQVHLRVDSLLNITHEEAVP